MKFSGSTTITATALFLASVTVCSHAFLAPSSSSLVGVRTSHGSSTSKTARYFLDTTKKGDKAAAAGSVNPIADIQSFLPSPEPVEVRPNLQGTTCLVSCGGQTVKPDLFYLLNHEDSAFRFSKIVAISSDVASTKKQLLTRQARYTGLLSKLDYQPADDSSSILPSTPDILEQASSWIAVVDSLQDLKLMAKSIDKVDNVAILYMASSCDEASTTAIRDTFETTLKVANPNVSLVIVDQEACSMENNKLDPFLEENNSAFPPLLFYDDESSSTATSLSNTTTPKNPAFLSEEALRMAVECLQLQAAAGKCLFLRLIDNNSANTATTSKQTPEELFPKLVKGLRNAGYQRSQEIDYMLQLGLSHYQKAIEVYETANPAAKNGVVHTNAWWEDKEFQKQVKQSSLRQEELVAANRAREERLNQQEEEQDKKFA
eukprot:scaffold7641_cov115-Cylindrotheca_fusiformis.AAC.1